LWRKGQHFIGTALTIRRSKMNLSNEQYRYLAKLKNGTGQLTEKDAGIVIHAIKTSVSSIMEMCYVLAVREGYKSLGYNTFKECVMKELAGVINYDYAHKMKNAGLVHMVVCPNLPMGSIVEGTLRLLHPIKSDEDKKEVWEAAAANSGIDGIMADRGDIMREINGRGLLTRIAETKELKKILVFTIYEFSPELTSKLDEVALELFEEFTKQSSFVTEAPLNKDHFDKALKELLRRLRIFILDKYPEIADPEVDDSEVDD
jgi:hypothetical protein